MDKLKFRAPALLWLPAGVMAVEAFRAGSAHMVMTPLPAAELLLAAPLGLPLALACRRLARSGYPGPALVAWLPLGGLLLRVLSDPEAPPAEAASGRLSDGEGTAAQQDGGRTLPRPLPPPAVCRRHVQGRRAALTPMR